jgi:hypothetical protein
VTHSLADPSALVSLVFTFFVRRDGVATRAGLVFPAFRYSDGVNR